MFGLKQKIGNWWWKWEKVGNFYGILVIFYDFFEFPVHFQDFSRIKLLQYNIQVLLTNPRFRQIQALFLKDSLFFYHLFFLSLIFFIFTFLASWVLKTSLFSILTTMSKWHLFLIFLTCYYFSVSPAISRDWYICLLWFSLNTREVYKQYSKIRPSLSKFRISNSEDLRWC
jgi:hypothetical protein